MLAILAAVMLAAAPQPDTVFTADGGRVVGRVVEEGPQGIAVQLPDGTFRRFARRDVLRIQYGDGSTSTGRPSEPPPAAAPPAQAAPAPQYAPPPPPQYAPPPPPRYAPPPPRSPPPAYPPRYPAQPPPAPLHAYTGPISPFYLTFGIGAAIPGGRAERGIDMNDVFGPQADFTFEGGLRLNPRVALALYAGLGAGDPASETRASCAAAGFLCDSAETRRIGLLFRYTFDPAARTTPWVSVGTGYETGRVSDDVGEVFEYSGWEMLRLMGGFDFRTSQVFGVGLYGGVSIGRYNQVDDIGVGTVDLHGTTHTMVEAGLRFTLFP